MVWKICLDYDKPQWTVGGSGCSFCIDLVQVGKLRLAHILAPERATGIQKFTQVNVPQPHSSQERHVFTPLFKKRLLPFYLSHHAKFTVHETTVLRAEAIKIMAPRAPGQGES